MSNSPLVTYTRISPNQSSRLGNKITTITIHHMAGILDVETVGRIFSDGYREASSNYAIDNDLNVGMYVEEKDRSWASSNGDNDRKAVTIELANDEVGGDWHVSDAVIEKCIELCVDICKRNGIRELNYTGDTSGNLTKHCWFAATLCPGPYLGSKFPYIAASVNARLNGAQPIPQPDPKPDDLLEEDGIFGPASTKAMQKWLGLDQTGRIPGQDKALAKYFPALTSCTWEDDGSVTIKYFQRYLTQRGFGPGPADGYLGPNTVKAWRRWLKVQQWFDIDVTSVFDAKAAWCMQRFLNIVLGRGETAPIK